MSNSKQLQQDFAQALGDVPGIRIEFYRYTDPEKLHVLSLKGDEPSREFESAFMEVDGHFNLGSVTFENAKLVGTISVVRQAHAREVDPVQVFSNSSLKTTGSFIVAEDGNIFTSFGEYRGTVFKTVEKFRAALMDQIDKADRRTRTLFHAARRAGVDLDACEVEGELLEPYMTIGGVVRVKWYSRERFIIEILHVEPDYDGDFREYWNRCGSENHEDKAFKTLKTSAIASLVTAQRAAVDDAMSKVRAAEAAIVRLKNLYEAR